MDLTAVWFAGVPGLLALFLWAIADLESFVLFAVLPAMIIPQTLLNAGPAQLALADVLLIVALGAWLLARMRGAGSAPLLQGNSLLAPSLVFLFVAVESLAWSERPADTIEFCVQLFEIVVLFPLLFASTPRSLNGIRRALTVFIGLTCIMAATTALLYLPRALTGDLEGQNLPGLNKNAIGSFVAAGLVLAYAMWLTEPRPRIKHLVGVAGLIEFAGLVSTVSRGSMIGAFFAIITLSFLLRRGRFLTVGLALASAVFFLTVIGVHSGVDRSLSGSYDSSVVRSYSYANAIEKIGDRPIVGTGAGTYQDHIPELAIALPDPNNMFLLTWAELGIVGIGALIFLLFRYGRLLLATRKIPHPTATLAAGAGCVTFSFFVHFQLDVTWTRGTTSLAFAMMGLLLAITRLSDDSAVPNRGLGPLGAADTPRAPALFSK
jgi:hypothetical protein